MKENMKMRSAALNQETHAILTNHAQSLGVDMAVVLRDLLTQYVDGSLVLKNNSSGGVTTRFYVPPSLMQAAESKAKAQGYSFGVLVGRLVDKALVQNHQGETNGN